MEWIFNFLSGFQWLKCKSWQQYPNWTQDTDGHWLRRSSSTKNLGLSGESMLKNRYCGQLNGQDHNQDENELRTKNKNHFQQEFYFNHQQNQEIQFIQCEAAQTKTFTKSEKSPVDLHSFTFYAEPLHRLTIYRYHQRDRDQACPRSMGFCAQSRTLCSAI